MIPIFNTDFKSLYPNVITINGDFELTESHAELARIRRKEKINNERRKKLQKLNEKYV